MAITILTLYVISALFLFVIQCEKLPAITDKQKQWAFEHCFEDEGFYTKGSVWCLHCGEVFPKTTSELIVSLAGDEAVCE